MAKNKVIFGEDVLIDLTEDTVSAETLSYGFTAHDRHGNQIVGTALSRLETIEYDYNIGYVDNGTWKYEKPTNTYIDIYEVTSGMVLFIILGQNVGTRFRAMFTTTDVRTKTSGNVTGTRIINVNTPASYATASYTVAEDGYLLIAKDNVGKTGIFTYVYNVHGLP